MYMWGYAYTGVSVCVSNLSPVFSILAYFLLYCTADPV